MRKNMVLALGLGMVLALSGVAMAQTNQANVTVSATVLGTCKFTSGGTMAFGTLDPSVGTDKNAVVTQPTFWCTKNAAYTIADDNGLHETGTTHQMIGASFGEYIPYTFTYTASGTGNGPTNPITMDIAGTVLGTDYTGKSADTYSDTVQLTITP